MTSEPNSPTFKKIVEAHPNASADAVNATYKAMKLIQADEAAQLQAKKERERIDKEARIAQLRKFLEGEKSNLEAEKENVEVSKSVLASSMLALSRDFRKYKATLAKLGAEGVDVTDRALSDEETLSLLSPELGDLQSRVDEVTAAERRAREAAEKQLAEERLAREEAEKRVATVEEEIARLKAAVAGADVETVGAKEAEKRAKEAERKAKAAKASGASGASSDVESLTAALVAKEKEIVTLKGSVERKKKLYDKISLDLKKERVAHTITKTTTESKINKLAGDIKSAGIGEATEEQVKRHSAYTSLSSTLSHSKAMVNELEKSLSAGRKAYDELKKSQQAASSKKRKRSDEVMQSSSGDPVWLADIADEYQARTKLRELDAENKRFFRDKQILIGQIEELKAAAGKGDEDDEEDEEEDEDGSMLTEKGRLRHDLRNAVQELNDTNKQLYVSIKVLKAGCAKCGFSKRANGGPCYNRSCSAFNKRDEKNELTYDAKAIALKAGVSYPPPPSSVASSTK